MNIATTSIELGKTPFGYGTQTDMEASMHGLDMLAEDRLASLEQDAERRRSQHLLATRLLRARRLRTSRPSRLRRARVRVGDVLVAAGLAIAGTADESAAPTSVGRPA